MNDPRRRPRDGTGGVWYKQNCTQKAAFIPILTSIAILLAIGCFRAFFLYFKPFFTPTASLKGWKELH